MNFTICYMDNQKPDEKLLNLLSSLKKQGYKIVSSYPLKIEDKLISYSTNESHFFKSMSEHIFTSYLIPITKDDLINEDILEEYEELSEENYDIIYPNLIEDGKIHNFYDWEGKNIELLQTFHIEKEIPQWGVAIKKDIISKFPDIDKFAYYTMLYKKIKDIRLKLSELSFLETSTQKSIKDRSYHSYAIREMIQLYDFKSELFYHLDWKKEDIAYATAYTLIGNILFEDFDYFNASNFFAKAALTFSNDESLKRLIESYYNMGEFDEALKIIKNYPINDTKYKEAKSSQIVQTKELIEQLESLAVENKITSEQIQKEIYQAYSGAPIDNILGAIYASQNNFQKAYESFYLAATKNPLNQVILENLAGCAKILQKEKEVEGLYTRLLPKR